MSVNFALALENFITQYIDIGSNINTPFLIEYDDDWPSPCYQERASNGQLVSWLPVKRKEQHRFLDLETALDISIHPSIEAFYTGFWSGNLLAKATQGELELLQAWNEDDYARLQQNLIGHVLMKRRLKQADTFFIAVTNQEEIIISIENQTGKVVLEKVGKAPHEVLAPDLATFLSSLITLTHANQ